MEENAMATINQPKPSEPKSPQQDQQPLQPGGPERSRDTSADPKRTQFENPLDDRGDELRNRG
jgi:hypothetical protein